MVQCVFCRLAAAGAHFSWEILMPGFVEGQLVIRPPCKNHKCKGQAKHTVKGVQALRCRGPSLRHAFQLRSSQFYGLQHVVRLSAAELGCLAPRRRLPRMSVSDLTPVGRRLNRKQWQGLKTLLKLTDFRDLNAAGDPRSAANAGTV